MSNPGISLRATFRPLRLAVLWATVSIVIIDWLLGPPPSPLVIGVFVWCAVVALSLLLVVPVFVLWPAWRTPGYGVAALWGGAAAMVGGLVVEPDSGAVLQQVREVAGYALAGVVGGVAYVLTLTFSDG
jgi:hypothetical protein